jgi:DNA-directed RNA polymerase specialized sigma24 family protein
MLRDSDYPEDLRRLVPWVKKLAGLLSDDEDDRLDIEQEMVLRILEVRAKKPDASDPYLRGAARNRAVEFATRKLHDGPRNRVTQRVDRSRMAPYDEDEIAHHSSAN